MLVIGGYALGLKRTAEVDAWGSYQELYELSKLMPRAFIGQSLTPERCCLIRSSRDGKLFIDYEIITGELKAAVLSLPDSEDHLLFDVYPVKLASKLTCCLIKQVAIDEVPEPNPKHAEDLKELWPEGLLEAIGNSPEHHRLYLALRSHFIKRFK